MPDGNRQLLDRRTVRIGRDPSADLVLSGDGRVSRIHAELECSDGQWTLLDLGSSNGTTVNKRRVDRHPLRDGDRICLGRTTLVYIAERDPKATEVGPETSEEGPDLTQRERQVLGLVAQGLTDRQIAEELSISANTVRSHLDRVGEKTGFRRRADLTRLAIERNLT
jgi:pSer/pThr/pTyr-binding forkhead associated (FHA) protein